MSTTTKDGGVVEHLMHLDVRGVDYEIVIADRYRHDAWVNRKDHVITLRPGPQKQQLKALALAVSHAWEFDRREAV